MELSLLLAHVFGALAFGIKVVEQSLWTFDMYDECFHYSAATHLRKNTHTNLMIPHPTPRECTMLPTWKTDKLPPQ